MVARDRTVARLHDAELELSQDGWFTARLLVAGPLTTTTGSGR